MEADALLFRKFFIREKWKRTNPDSEAIISENVPKRIIEFHRIVGKLEEGLIVVGDAGRIVSVNSVEDRIMFRLSG